MKTRGLTLLELMISMMLLAMVGAALVGAWTSAARARTTTILSAQAHQESIEIEEKLERLLRTAFLTTDANDETSYFKGLDANGTSTEAAHGIVFTAAGTRPAASVRQADEPLEDLNQRFGAQGGVVERALSLTPVGDPSGRTGLFLREQRPADGDFEQGGYESLLLEGVSDLNFEFFDGAQWVVNWDTQEGQRRLPAAVKVEFTINGEAKSLIVRLPASDIDEQNPLTTEDGA